ncbi:hypothetical protein PoB_003625100 [Plakobranchus ocellatus]|uniref:Uncharacterized protein n=1 Tax=Plakobranchus ocellatus TaxID=259542 RepID=A0AAV4AEX3_9GAST|nr:hypothetical protein PoB_003625100 [Plakobranchus ocellatus]
MLLALDELRFQPDRLFGLRILLMLRYGGVGGTVVSESTLKSAGTPLSRVRAPPPAPWPDGGPKSLRSPCCGLAMYNNQPTMFRWFLPVVHEKCYRHHFITI